MSSCASKLLKSLDVFKWVLYKELNRTMGIQQQNLWN